LSHSIERWWASIWVYPSLKKDIQNHIWTWQHVMVYFASWPTSGRPIMSTPAAPGAQSYIHVLLCLAAKNEERRLAELWKR
jgi:hypothetical protein